MLTLGMGIAVIVGLLVAIGGTQAVARGIRERLAHRRHAGGMPQRIADVSPGQTVLVTGRVVSPDVHPSPAGSAPAAHVFIDFRLMGHYGGLMRGCGSHALGDEVWIDDGSGMALVRMEFADLRDRAPIEYVWAPYTKAPDAAKRGLATLGWEIPRTSSKSKNEAEFVYRERALRHGDALRAHALVLGVEDADGRRRVLLGTDRRVPTRVGNLLDADLAALGRAAARSLFGGLAAVGLGLTMVVVAGIVIASASR